MQHHFFVKLSRYVVAGVVLAGWCLPAHAQESTVLLALTPVQTAFVKGDLSKFRAMNWTKDGAQSGIRELMLDAKPGKDVTVSFDGNGMVGDADYAGSMLITKDNVGYVKVHYDSFRKYYENRGGYYPFPSAGMNLHTLNQDLQMDLGHFAFEVGKGSADNADLSLAYERDTKNGTKDSTTWGYVKDYAFSGNTTVNRKKIAPVFVRNDETTDTVTVKGKADVYGFKVKGEEKYVFFKANNTRQEQIYGSTGAALENEIIRRTETPQTKELSSTLRAERWTLNDKSYISFGYHFGHLRNSMLYFARDYTSAGNFTPAGFVTGGTFRNGVAQNIQDTHTLTGMMLSNLTDKLTFISRFKGELKSSYGTSDVYSLNISQVATADAYQANENKVTSSGESFSLRYAGVPRTSLYADLDLSQERNWKSLLLPAEYAENVNRVPASAATLGMRITPVNKVTVTTELKHSEKKDKNDQVTGDSAIYINKLNTTSDDLSTRLAWRPFKWLENSFKVKAAMNTYHLQQLDYDPVKMPGSERDFVYGVTLTPTDQLMFNLSYALQLSKTGGIGSQLVTAPPAYTANVYTWALSTSYAPTENFIFFNNLEYSRAKNPTNVDGKSITTTLSAMGPMLLGVDEEWYDIDNGIKWVPKKNLTIEPHYAYYAFRNFEGVSTGNYSAHVVWLDVDVKW